MLYAHEAKRKTLENIEECTTKELSKIEKQINEAVANGKFSISNSGSLQPESMRRLEEGGYKVTIKSQYNESYYVISWE